MSYKRIALRLGVSPSSVFGWTNDIVLTPEQHEENRRGPGGPWNPEDIRKRAAAWAARCRQRRASWQDEGRNVIKLVNSDARMIAMFRRFLTERLAISPEKIRYSINVYTNNGLTIEQIKSHWLEVLDLPRSCARKHVLNHMPTSSSGRARNKLPYGVCSLIVHDTRMVQHIYGAIQEYAGFDEPAWLD
jgi:hypothetical protein